MSRIAEASGLPLVECQGSKFHSPTPLTVTQVEVAGEMVALCGTCQANLAVFQQLMTDSNGTLAWEIRREFGNRIRVLGMKDWAYRSASG